MAEFFARQLHREDIDTFTFKFHKGRWIHYRPFPNAEKAEED